MSLKHGLLGLINESDKSGYDIDKLFKESLIFFWKATTSQIYREIQTLVSEGLIKEDLIIQNDKPNKKNLSITKKGKEELNNWLLDFSSINNELNERIPILMKTFFLYNLSIEDAISFLEHCISVYTISDKNQHISQDIINTTPNDYKKTFYQLCHNYGDYHINASLSWAKESLETLKKIKQNQNQNNK